MRKVLALSLPRGDNRSACGLRFLLLVTAFALLFFAQHAMSQFSTVEVATAAQFPKADQAALSSSAVFSTDGTWLAYTTGNALWSQSIKGGKLRRLFTTGTVLPDSDIKAKMIYPQTEISDGIIVFLASDEGGESGHYGLYAIKADGSEGARRVADSTQAPAAINWSNEMNPEGVYGFFQVSKDVVVFGLQGGTLYAANIDGTHLRPIWLVPQTGGFRGCSSGGEYHDIFVVNQAFQPATDGTRYAFGAANFLNFAGVYHGPLTTVDACGDLIDTGDSINDPLLKILPGQPQAGVAFAFPEGQNFQIDDGFVYFGAFSTHGVSSTEDYYGYFKVPLAGGKPSVLVSNISHVPGLVGPHGQFSQVKLLGFAVRNGRFVFEAVDEAQNDPQGFYMVDGNSYTKIFESGTSVSNHCVSGLESGFADEATINQSSLAADGKLAFYAFDLPPTFPNASGPCSYPVLVYDQPLGFFVVDTSHRLIATETEISLSVAEPVVYNEKPSLRIKVMPAEGAANPRDLVPTGMVSVYFTNPEFHGDQQPTPNTATLDSDGKATIALGAQTSGTYSYVVAYGGDTNFSSSASEKLVFPLHAAAPVFSVKGGTYNSAQSITLTDSTPYSTIYYTTNGATPTMKSKQYGNPIQVSSKETIKAMAVAIGDAESAVVPQSYAIK